MKTQRTYRFEITNRETGNVRRAAVRASSEERAIDGLQAIYPAEKFTFRKI